MVEEISIVVYPLSEVVFDGIAGRLMWQAPGLNIYLSGKYDAKRWPALAHLALEQCIARHIPAASLRRVGGFRQKHVKPVAPAQKGLSNDN